MSDYIEHACRNCGSLLHFECERPAAPAPTPQPGATERKEGMRLCGCTECKGLGQRDYPRACDRADRIAAALAASARPETTTKVVNGLAIDKRFLPCGCVLCICEDEERCHGCGAKHCGKHPGCEFEQAAPTEPVTPSLSELGQRVRESFTALKGEPVTPTEGERERALELACRVLDGRYHTMRGTDVPERKDVEAIARALAATRQATWEEAAQVLDERARMWRESIEGRAWVIAKYEEDEEAAAAIRAKATQGGKP